MHYIMYIQTLWKNESNLNGANLPKYFALYVRGSMLLYYIENISFKYYFCEEK